MYKCRSGDQQRLKEGRRRASEIYSRGASGRAVHYAVPLTVVEILSVHRVPYSSARLAPEGGVKAAPT